MRKSLIIASLVFTSSLFAAQPVNPPQPVVNINTATVVQVAYLPGIGPKTAEAIVAARPFKAAADLDKVKGIGAKKLAALLPYVAVSGETTVTVKIKAERPAPKGPESIAPPKSK